MNEDYAGDSAPRFPTSPENSAARTTSGRTASCAGRMSTDHIHITSKEDKPGLDIRADPGTVGEKRQHSRLRDPRRRGRSCVQRFLHRRGGGRGQSWPAAACTPLTANPARHNGIHRFFLGKGSRVKYLEKHVGLGQGFGLRSIDPVTEAYLDEDSVLEMDTSQIGGVDRTKRITRGEVGKNAKLLIRERLFTEKEQIARTALRSPCPARTPAWT